ncbi:MAG: DUF4124 domain-containing protein [Mariprofundaceae bacterium]|nr:DUF4124 domain-containing protein [Mariprofundaceae bacterium]
MLRLMVGALLMACCSVWVASAADIYQWKDVSGITHFTDDAMNVPEKYRKTAKRKVSKLQVSGGSEGVQHKSQSLGSAVWLAKCASCHTVGGDKKDKLGLGALAVNQKTKFPATVEEIIPQLRRATSGRLSNMPSVDVNADALRQIAAFILGVK